MTRLLYINSSPRGEESESNRIAGVFLAAYLPGAPDVEVDTLDLWDGSLPGYYGRGVEAKMNALAGKDPVGAAAKAWADVQRVFARFVAADEYLFTVPMWNHGVPWILKHFIDTVSQRGMLFDLDSETGYTGRLGAAAPWSSSPAGSGRPTVHRSSAPTSTRTTSWTGCGSAASPTSTWRASSPIS